MPAFKSAKLKALQKAKAVMKAKTAKGKPSAMKAKAAPKGKRISPLEAARRFKSLKRNTAAAASSKQSPEVNEADEDENGDDEAASTSKVVKRPAAATSKKGKKTKFGDMTWAQFTPPKQAPKQSPEVNEADAGAGGSGDKEDEDDECDDESSITVRQRLVWKTAMEKPPGSKGGLAQEVHDAYNKLTNVKHKNAFRNAMMPKNTQYGDTIVVTHAKMAKIRNHFVRNTNDLQCIGRSETSLACEWGGAIMSVVWQT